MTARKHPPGQTMTLEEFHREVAEATPEADFEATIEAACRDLQLLCYHTKDSRGSAKGYPDLSIAVPVPDPLGRQPFVIHAELKREGKEPEPEQWAWIRALREAARRAWTGSRSGDLQLMNGWCFVWTPSDMDEVTRVLGGLGR